MKTIHAKIKKLSIIQKQRFEKHKKGIFEREFENRVDKYCKEHHIPYRKQFAICPYIIDLYFPTKCIALEIDEPHHAKRENYDFKREHYIMSFGICVVRYKQNKEDVSIDEFIDCVLRGFKKKSKHQRLWIMRRITRCNSFYSIEKENRRFYSFDELRRIMKDEKEIKRQKRIEKRKNGKSSN